MSLLTSSVTTVENVVVVPIVVAGWNVPLPLPCRIITSGPVVARERQVDVAVAVEIGRHYVLRFGRQRDDGRSAELPEAVAE